MAELTSKDLAGVQDHYLDTLTHIVTQKKRKKDFYKSMVNI